LELACSTGHHQGQMSLTSRQLSADQRAAPSRKLAPGARQVSVAQAPRLWWRHAARCVLAERCAALGAAARPTSSASTSFGSQTSLSPAQSTAPSSSFDVLAAAAACASLRAPHAAAGSRRAAFGQTLGYFKAGGLRHARAYAALRNGRARLGWALAHGGAGAAGAAAAAEAGASAHEAALWRWRVWALGARRQVRAQAQVLVIGAEANISGAGPPAQVPGLAFCTQQAMVHCQAVMVKAIKKGCRVRSCYARCVLLPPAAPVGPCRDAPCSGASTGARSEP
jgi:hypothetical protein